MTIEQEIWNDFRELSEYSVFDRIPYARAKAIFGLKPENTISRVNYIGGHQYIQEDIDKKIDEALKSEGEIKWDNILSLYPKRPEIILPKGVVYPTPQFRSKKEWREIEWHLLNNWSLNAEKLNLLFPTERSAVDYLIDTRWGGNIVCPYCGNRKITELQDKKRFFCSGGNCRYKFSPNVGTIFQNTKLPLTKWYEGIYLLTSIKTHKISTPQIARALDITTLSAWKMASKIKEHIKDDFIINIRDDIFGLKTGLSAVG